MSYLPNYIEWVLDEKETDRIVPKPAFGKTRRQQAAEAAFSPSLPSNPIPFLIELEAIVKESGLPGLRGSDARKILWVVNAIAYGSLGLIEKDSDTPDKVVGVAEAISVLLSAVRSEGRNILFEPRFKLGFLGLVNTYVYGNRDVRLDKEWELLYKGGE